ncbi:dihydropteroate synthase [Haloquadratum walsbyi]|jgi:dihydropteroate synthase|uniref:dihydropteroate synthase n=1 Tax=Haloquadratum walsbyi (strain DSM 16854 / JCM 12705 / C23) TaxID=768065 RepID=G0LJ19_HALWC|nr:dihydropteroate synthase [Haloquadratum walsbyi]CCC40587.1 dihydropteroate synthase [Haloquadratum walsbyi C23]
MRSVDAAGLSIGDESPPRIMGVLNISKESPYDPSVFDEPDAAATYVDSELIDEGADIVDIGLESANKRFDVLSAEQELTRLETAIEAIESVSGDAVFSIETRYHEVADAALSRGFDMVNDICGFADPKMPEVCSEYDVAVGKMASPPDLTRPGAIENVDDIYEALAQNGFTEKTIIDPAFGGWSEEKTLADDRETFQRLREFRGLGRPILVSINRKNFLRSIADRSTEEALSVSLAATSLAVERGAHVIRTHDVAETRDAALIGDAFTPDRPSHHLTTDDDSQVTAEELDVTTSAEAGRHLDRLGISSMNDITDKSIIHTLEIDGLSRSAVTELSTVTAKSDSAIVTAVESESGREANLDSDSQSSGIFLAGTPASLDAIATTVDDSVLTEILTSITQQISR